MPEAGTVHPDSDPHPDDAVARYLAATGPVYRMLTTLVGQLSLLLLLSADRTLGQASAATAQTLVQETEAILATLPVPAMAGRHHWLLGQALDRLSDVLKRLRWGRMDAATSVRLIRSAHELLRLAALPQAGLSLADLRRACCSCMRSEPV
jgi:hypothetical protein